MTLAKNLFKARLAKPETQIGLWMALAHPGAAEICAGAGFDWLVIDAEHGPNGLAEIMAQLRVLSGSSHAVVRVRENDRALIKQMLDIGAQTILVPMIETAAEAQEAVGSVRYPPEGARGVGAALARASDYGRITDYLHTANKQVCLLVQVESCKGIDALDEILAVEGVDGVFVGPADLAADMGYVGKPEAAPVQAVVVEALSRIRAAGKPAGILTSNRELARRYALMGVEFLAVGADVGVFARGLAELRQGFP